MQNRSAPRRSLDQTLCNNNYYLLLFTYKWVHCTSYKEHCQDNPFIYAYLYVAWVSMGTYQGSFNFDINFMKT